ncbi:DUF6457 domain-containing protein [Pseudonocardia phyllosphaerae]|uniref:DUF6457 domain-containing protein n=1 Tax=Pseudonocardia phyllosphaerae TaxID=3390502 RepID=UPI00397BB3D4
MAGAEGNAMAEWVTAVAAELGLDDVDAVGTVERILDLTSDVAHGVSRPAAPVTAYLLGLAAGKADKPDDVVGELSERIVAKAESWEG